jgi:hypothetical protein
MRASLEPPSSLVMTIRLFIDRQAHHAVERSNSTGAFAILDLTVVLLIIAVGVLAYLIYLPRLPPPAPIVIGCQNRLKQVALSLNVWEGDHENKLPWEVSTNTGGARELLSSGLASVCFRVMSNELSTPKTLLCPSDNKRCLATDFLDLADSNISYFISVSTSLGNSKSILSGDRNLEVSSKPVEVGIFVLATNLSVGWTRDLHGRSGNILFADERVTMTSSNLSQLVQKQVPPENRILVP